MAHEVLVDSSILLDIFTNNEQWGDWAEHQLAEVRSRAIPIINPIVYSEVSIGFHEIEELERVLSVTGVRLRGLPREALFLAGKAFLKYRRRKGTKQSVLPDFFIGAHAAVTKIPLLTRDARRIRSYYPSVSLIAP